MADVYDNGPDDPTLNAVLLCLANSADDSGGNCFPGTELIAQRTRYAERTVIRAIAALEEQGWVTVIQRGRGRPKKTARKHELAQWRTQYEINVSRLKGCQSVTLSGVAPETGKGDSGDRERVTLCPKKGDFDANPPHPLFGVSIPDPSLEPSTPIVPQGGTGGAQDVGEDCEYTEEQQAHLDSIADAGKREEYAGCYRRENAQLAAEVAEAARKLMARAAQIGALKREMPDLGSAVGWTMRQCSFVQTRKGRGIEAVLELAMRQDGREPWEVGERMAAAWAKFKAGAKHMRWMPGPLAFFRDGMWNDERAWPWDHVQARRDGEAAAGRAR